MQVEQTATLNETEQMAGKYLTFHLGNETYGLEILRVREIIGLMDITSVPRTPSFIRGVINLRGKIIPVLDLRVKFAMEIIEDTEQTCIIVVELQVDGLASQIGVLVDGVSEVLNIGAEDLEPTPSFGSNVDASFIRGMAKTNGSVSILLNVENALGSTEINAMMSTAAVETPS